MFINKQTDDGSMPAAAAREKMYAALGARALGRATSIGIHPDFRFLSPQSPMTKLTRGPRIKILVPTLAHHASILSLKTMMDMPLGNLRLSPAPGSPRISMLSASAARDSGAVQSVVINGKSINYLPSQSFTLVESDSGHYKGVIQLELDGQGKATLLQEQMALKPASSRPPAYRPDSYVPLRPQINPAHAYWAALKRTGVNLPRLTLR